MMATTGIFVLGPALSVLQASFEGISLEKSHLIWSHVWPRRTWYCPSSLQGSSQRRKVREEGGILAWSTEVQKLQRMEAKWETKS